MQRDHVQIEVHKNIEIDQVKSQDSQLQVPNKQVNDYYSEHDASDYVHDGLQ